MPPLSSSFRRVMFKTLTCMNTHTHTHNYTQSHTRTRTQTQTYAWKVPATSRATSYNDLRPSEPTRVNVSLTRKLNWHFRRPVWWHCHTTKHYPKRVRPRCLHVDHSRSLCKCHWFTLLNRNKTVLVRFTTCVDSEYTVDLRQHLRFTCGCKESNAEKHRVHFTAYK